jgi:nucleotide-binding universal stress UspA family protein
MISKVLVAMDDSEVAWKAVKYAMEFAQQTGSTLVLLTVVEESPFFSASVPEVITSTHLRETIEDYLRQVAEAILAKAERLCQKSGIPTQGIIRSGHPVEEIVRVAEESKADLVILGSRGRGSLKTALIGSVVFGVLHKEMKAPILVVR